MESEKDKGLKDRAYVKEHGIGVSAEISEDVRRHPILQYFTYGHLPPPLQEISRPIADIALEMSRSLKNGPELSAGLRKLLEAKDCLVRAAL